MSAVGWIGVDLDGTLAHYDGWKGELHIGPPIQPMVERVQRWLAEGKKVKIFTARVSTRIDAELAEVVGAVHSWSEKHIGVRLEVTCIKDYACICIYDDRCVQIERNTGRIIGVETL